MCQPTVHPKVAADRIALVLIMAGFIGGSATAADPWQILSEDPVGERFRVTVTPPAPVCAAGPGGVVVSFPGPVADRQPGAPDIGVMVQTIPGRPGFHAVIRVVATEFRDEPNTNVIPAETTRRVYVDDNVYRIEQVRSPDPVIYTNNAFWPPVLMRLDEAWMGTNQYVRLACWPAQYNPVQRVLRLHTRITGELCFVRDAAHRRESK